MDTSRFSSNNFWLISLLILIIGFAGFLCVAPAGMLASQTHAAEPACVEGQATFLCTGGQMTNHFQMLELLSSGIPQTVSFAVFLIFLAGAVLYRLIQNDYNPNLAETYLIGKFNAIQADFSASPLLEFLRQGIMHPKLYSVSIRTGG